MIGELMVGAGAVTAGGLTYARRRRVRLYRDLELGLTRTLATGAPDLNASLSRATPDFSDRLATISDLLPDETFAAVKAEAERLESGSFCHGLCWGAVVHYAPSSSR